MKKNCNVIKDLLPLYVDGVCSEESKQLVEEHLKNCHDCQEYLKELKFDIKEDKESEVNVFKKFAKMINFKIIRNAVIITCGILAISIPIIRAINNYEFSLEYNEDMDITFKEFSNRWELLFSANIEGVDYGTVLRTKENEENVNLIFITRKTNLRDYLLSKKDKIKSIRPPEINYESINPSEKMKVYYTTEDLDYIKNASEEELKQIIDNSTLIYTNDLKTSSITCNMNNKEFIYTLTYYKTNEQIVESIGDEDLPDDLLLDVYTSDGNYKKVVWTWAYFDKAPDIFKKIEDYMVNKGGVCTLNNN